MKFFFSKKSNGVAQHHSIPEVPVSISPEQADPDIEMAALIGLALHMHMNKLREYENAVITMQQMMKPYSPWSSKIYGLRQQPMHIPGLRHPRK